MDAEDLKDPVRAALQTTLSVARQEHVPETNSGALQIYIRMEKIVHSLTGPVLPQLRNDARWRPKIDLILMSIDEAHQKAERDRVRGCHLLDDWLS